MSAEHRPDAPATDVEQRVPGAAHAGSARGDGITVVSHLLAGIGFYGALGWLADRLLHATVFLPIGLVVGTAAAVYLIIKRFGGDE